MKILIVFRGRTATLSFYQALNKLRVPCSIVNTPRVLSASCGLSIELDAMYLKIVLNLLNTHNSLSFVGVYKIIKYGNAIKYVKIQ